MSTTYRFRLFCILAAITLALGIFSGRPARADSTFHTQRIPLMPLNGAPLHDGFVVDIHTNGPVNYALERYVLVGASPGTTYQVATQVYMLPDCTGDAAATLDDATFATNAAGNGEAGAKILPAAVEGLHGMTLYLVWQVATAGEVAYQTACIPVALD